MWSVTQSQNGLFRCQNARTGNLTDRSFEACEQAQEWADVTNRAEEQRIAENKRQAAERKARLAALGPLADQRFIDPHAH
jgi:hypothetical protein